MATARLDHTTLADLEVGEATPRPQPPPDEVGRNGFVVAQHVADGMEPGPWCVLRQLGPRVGGSIRSVTTRADAAALLNPHLANPVAV